MNYCLPINSLRYEFEWKHCFICKLVSTIEELSKIRHFAVSHFLFYFSFHCVVVITQDVQFAKNYSSQPIIIIAVRHNSSGNNLHPKYISVTAWIEVLSHTFIVHFRKCNIEGVLNRNLSAAAWILRHATRGHLVLESNPQLCPLLITPLWEISWKQRTQLIQQIKDPNLQEADLLALRSWGGVEETTWDKSSCWSERDLTSGLPYFKSGVLITWPCCLLENDSTNCEMNFLASIRWSQ